MIIKLYLNLKFPCYEKNDCYLDIITYFSTAIIRKHRDTYLNSDNAFQKKLVAVDEKTGKPDNLSDKNAVKPARRNRIGFVSIETELKNIQTDLHNPKGSTPGRRDIINTSRC